MTRVLMVALLALGGELLLVGQQAPVPEIPFEVTEPLELPDDLYFGEIAGVALNSERHVFVYTRTGGSGASILQGERAQLFEFGPDGRFVREIGRNLYSKAWAHAVRVDRDDNIWLVDNGSDLVVKLGPDRRLELTLGRRDEAVLERLRKPPIPTDAPDTASAPRVLLRADRRGLRRAGQRLRQRRLHQLACPQVRPGRSHREDGGRPEGGGPWSVRPAARHRRRQRGPRLRRRSEQSPDPGAR